MENPDLLVRLQRMSDHLFSNSPIIGIDWKVTLLEAKKAIEENKTELEDLRKKADIIRMCTRWS